MLKKITVLLTLFLGCNLNLISQEEFTPATFKEGNAQKFIISKFHMFNGRKETGKGTVTVTFTINEKGEVENPIPEINSNKSNGLNALLSIQKTNGLWNPTQINGKPVSHTYKVEFRFLTEKETSYSSNILKAKKMLEKEQYEKALKVYDKLLKDNPDEPNLYKQRAEIKSLLLDEIGSKVDMEKYSQLKQEFLLHIRLGIFSKERRRLMYKQEVIRRN